LIGYLEGRIIRKEEDRILLLVDHVGYEVLLPQIVMESVGSKAVGDDLSLYVYYHLTERQPKPVLIGFNHEIEKEFFERFISVEDIGPLKAVRALELSVREIARAIEDRDAGKLKRLKGIGGRTAQKIIASLEGKMGKFALIRHGEEIPAPAAPDLEAQVIDVLVSQLGYRAVEAKQLVGDALRRNPDMATAEALFEEVFRGESMS